jgi:UDP-N-acetylmuramate: L-alanyl-gamma-D-glutamyl-meso-diaminopimelate ligase
MRIYFMGICGTAMGNAALLLRQAGHEVLGADTGVYPPMSTVLREAGIEILEGYDPARLERLAPDLVVIGNAQSRLHPEVEWLLETRRFRFTSLPALLSELVLTGRRSVVIAGTHGKTTTTAITTHLLQHAAAGPGWLIGGAPRCPDHGAEIGTAGAPFVIEGDEYDSAFFDKRSKFIHYQPHIAALNAVELDHIDIFLSLDDYLRTFRHLTRIVPRNGWIVSNGDDANAEAIVAGVKWTRIVRVGEGEGNTVRLHGFREDAGGAHFSLTWNGAPWCTIAWQPYGVFNARNAAVAATCAALLLSPDDPVRYDPAPALASFLGVRRRQEHRLETDVLLVVEDFGHHPTALRETLTSLRARHPGRSLWACFEPRSNSARTEVFREGFENSLALADRVFLGAVNRADKLAPGERLPTAEMAARLTARGVPAHAAETNAACLAALREANATEKRPRLVVFFSNGSFDGIIDAFARQP